MPRFTPSRRGWALQAPRLNQLPLALLLTATILAAAAPWWVLPLQRDQGVYAACGSALLDGIAPYQHCWDTKGPFTHFTYAFAELFFGARLWGPYVINALIASATAIALIALARRWFKNSRLAWGLGLVYGLLLVSIPFDHNAQSEGFANLFIVLAVLVWEIGTAQSRVALKTAPIILVGALLGAAAGFKYTILAPAGLLGIALWLAAPLGLRADRRGWLRLAGLAGAGAVGVWLLGAAYLALRGSLDLAVEHILFMFAYFPRVQVNPDLLLFPGESGPPLFYWQRTVREFLRLPVLYALAFSGLGIAFVRREKYRIPLSVWLLASLTIVFPQKVFTLYHWLLALPAVVLAGGVVLQRRGKTLVGLIGLAVAINIGARFYFDQWQIAGPLLTGQVTRQELFESLAVWDELQIAEYVAARTSPEELIWVWGNHSVIYYLSERSSPTRFIFNSPLMARIGPNPYQPSWIAEIEADLYARPPTYLIVTWYDRTWFDYVNPNQQFDEISAFRDFLSRYYRREVFLGRFEINRLIPWWSRAAAPELLEAVTLIDLLEVLPDAVQQSAPNDPIEVVEFEIPGEQAYPALLLHAEGRVIYDLELPTDGPLCFRAALALDPQSWGWGGDGATFRLELNEEPVFEQYVANDEADRRWHPVLVNLSEFAGRRVRLSLWTGPGPQIDFTGDRAGWGLPRILRAPGSTCEEIAVVRES